jgi:hypothetical protein
MYYLKLNGVKHKVVVDKNGNTTYDPPLPEEKKRRWKKNVREMCDAGVSPGLRTDTLFHKGRGTLLQQMDGDEEYCKYLVHKAKQKGYTPGANDVYIGQMADSDGDPNAWFKPGEGLAEMRKRLQKTGKGCDMPGLHVKPREFVKKPSKALNPRIAKGLANYYKATGEAEGMNNKQIAEMVVKKHSYSARNKKQ